MKKLPKFDWETVQKSNEIILKIGKIIKIKFLNNDVDTDTWKDKNEKEKTKFIFDVLNMDTNQEKEFSTLSNPLMNDLKLYQPLKNKEFSIRKYRIGAEVFDVEYEVIHLNPSVE